MLSAAITFRQDQAYTALRTLLATYTGSVEPLPEDTFKDAGTSVRTCLLVLRVPTAA